MRSLLAPSGAVLLAVIPLMALFAGCTGGPTTSPQDDTPERTSADADDPTGDWVGGGCDQLDAGVYMATPVVRSLVPERFPIAEFLPGLTMVFVSLSHCETLALEGNVTRRDVDQARLQVFTGSTTLYVIEWVVPDDDVRAGLAAHGLDVKAGTIETTQTPGLTTELEGTYRVGVDGAERVQVSWRANVDTPWPQSGTYTLLQDDEGADRTATWWLSSGASASIPYDHCLVTSSDPTWSAAIAASPQAECFIQNAWGVDATLSF